MENDMLLKDETRLYFDELLPQNKLIGHARIVTQNF